MVLLNPVRDQFPTDLFKPFQRHFILHRQVQRLPSWPMAHAKHIIIVLFYIILATLLTFTHRTSINRRTYWPLQLFLLPTIVAAAIQVMFYGLTLGWAGLTFSLMVIFVTMQNDMVISDSLTGLNNRRHLEKYIAIELHRLRDSDLLVGFLLDLNDFKSVNNKFGHATGDEDFIARYAGDEFVVVTKTRDHSLPEQPISRLKENVSNYTTRTNLPYDLAFSSGCAIWTNSNGYDFSKFLQNADQQMYINKNTTHSNNTSS